MKTVLYIGVTNDLDRRLYEHLENKGNAKTFAGKNYCYNLVYYEHFTHVEYAIKREKELKKWRREKKDVLITSFNPAWKFLNKDITD
jgi:putative endonuclease